MPHIDAQRIEARRLPGKNIKWVRNANSVKMGHHNKRQSILRILFLSLFSNSSPSRSIT